MPENSAEFEENLRDMKEGIKEIYEELFGYDVDFYVLDPNQKSGVNREIKFKKYLDPIKMCGRLEEDPTKKDRTDMQNVDTKFQYKRYIYIPVLFFAENGLSTEEDDLVRCKIRINGADYFPYEVQFTSFMFGEVLVYKFVCRHEKSPNMAVIRP